MRKRKIWTCDFKECEEIAQWYRKRKRELLKLCTKHEAYLARQHYGGSLDLSELNEDDIRYLEGKERRKEFAKRHPFDVRLYSLEDGTTGFRIRVRDRETDEWRSFVLKKSDHGRFDENYRDLERKGFSPKPSIDEYVKSLRNGINGSI